MSDEEDVESLSDLDALLEGQPDPKTLPDELKADEVFPAQFDIVDLQSSVKSQGKRGVCSIFSTVALMEHLYIKKGAVKPDFSEHFLQWSVKAELGRFKNTSGSNGAANISAINKHGVVEESISPYESSPWDKIRDERCDKDNEKRPTLCFTNGDPDEQILEAKRWKLPPSRWIQSSRENLKAFIHENQTGVVIGMTFFYQSWNHRKSKLPVNLEYRRQGYVLFPNEADQEKSLEKRAGHSILIVGWDDNLEVPVVDENGESILDDEGNPIVEKGFFLFKNSWGTSVFGVDNPHGAGYGWLSMSYVEEYGRSVSSRPPQEELIERCDDGLDNNFDGATDCDDLSCADFVSCQETPAPDLSFQVSSDEQLEIPDQGEVSSELIVAQQGNIDQLTIDLDIEHTFSGDLEITLTSPSGTKLTLIDADTERDTPNLKITQELPSFRGEWASGTWKLVVADRFERDLGTLITWSLKGHLSETPLSESLSYSVAPNLMIPDHEPSGMMSSLNVDAIGQLEAVTVWVKVDHTYRGDLNVKLIHPSGAHVILFNRDGRNSVNLDLTKTTPTFVGLDAAGEWVLHVTDLGQGDEGVLVEWGLDILVPAEVPVVEK
jgi:subtilisin-like proprotein convertase family protein